MITDKVCTFEKVPKEQFIEDALTVFLSRSRDAEYARYGATGPKEVLGRIWEDIKLPRRATPGSVGYDFFLPWDITMGPQDQVYIPTGICCNFHTTDLDRTGFYLQIYPKSGLGFKYQIAQAGTVGIIDEDYYDAPNHGHIFVKLVPKFFVDGFVFSKVAIDSRPNINEIQQPYYLKDRVACIEAGKPFVQGVIAEAFGAHNDDETLMKRRTGGLGSTSR